MAKELSKASEENPFIFFAQEPNMDGLILHHLSKINHTFHYEIPKNFQGDERLVWPRAILYASRELDLLKINNL